MIIQTFKTKNILKSVFVFLLVLSMLILPIFVMAQPTTPTVCTGNTLSTMICRIHRLLNSIIPVLISLGVVYLVWGVVTYVIAGGEEAKKQGRDRIVYGIIGLAVIVGIFGLVNFVVNTFDIGGQVATLPTVTAASGAGCTTPSASTAKLQSFFGYITCIINDSIIPLMFAIAIAFFIWGVIQFVILGAGEEAKRTQGRTHMIWGIVALVVMLGVWGLVRIVGGTFGLNTNVLPGVRPPTSAP